MLFHVVLTINAELSEVLNSVESFRYLSSRRFNTSQVDDLSVLKRQRKEKLDESF